MIGEAVGRDKGKAADGVGWNFTMLGRGGPAQPETGSDCANLPSKWRSSSATSGGVPHGVGEFCFDHLPERLAQSMKRPPFRLLYRTLAERR